MGETSQRVDSKDMVESRGHPKYAEDTSGKSAVKKRREKELYLEVSLI